MHWVDLLIVAIIAWFALTAFSTGLIREAVTAAAMIAGAVLAGRFYGDLSENIVFLISDDSTRSFVSFVAIFAGIVVIGQLLAATLRQLAALLMLGPFDHLGGALFGLAKGMLLVELLLIVASAYPISARVDSALEQSTLAAVFLDRVPLMLRLLPDEFEDAVAGADELARGGSPLLNPPQ